MKNEEKIKKKNLKQTACLTGSYAKSLKRKKELSRRK